MQTYRAANPKQIAIFLPLVMLLLPHPSCVADLQRRRENNTVWTKRQRMSMGDIEGKRRAGGEMGWSWLRGVEIQRPHPLADNARRMGHPLL
jgi:hypothetical protein